MLPGLAVVTPGVENIYIYVAWLNLTSTSILCNTYSWQSMNFGNIGDERNKACLRTG